MTASATVDYFPQLKSAATRLLLELAAREAPDIYGCGACQRSPAGMCEDHCAAAVAAARFERAAVMAGRAGTADDVQAALLCAYGDGTS
jgi:hypothetical protein